MAKATLGADLVALDALTFYLNFVTAEYKCNLFNVRMQDIPNICGDSTLRPLEDFRIILFVSHRWETSSIPDKIDRHAKAVTNLFALHDQKSFKDLKLFFKIVSPE